MGINSQSPTHTVWKSDLYRMQLDAPVPIPILADEPNCNCDTSNFLGQDFHGDITHREAANLLECQPDGAYLIRRSKSANGQFFTLSLKFNAKIHHYKLFYDPQNGVYVREKRYDSVKSLVADGLVTMYLELKAPLVLQRLATIDYQESPYMTLNKKKLETLTKQRAKFPNGFKNIFGNQNNPTQSIKFDFAEKFEKNHQFKVTTFKGLNWCELCGNFLWGFSAQGVKCDDCGLIAHGRCSEKFPNDCVPDLKYLRGVFGIELTTLLAAHNATLPFVVTKCITEVEARGLTSEGIYRLSGFADEIDAIKLALDKDGQKADLSQDKYPNINVIAGALKLYLRLLPIPLITFVVYPLLVKAMQQKNFDQRLSELKRSLMSLPREHYNTLKFMTEHLHRVALHSAINKMNAHNLATVFAPTLIGPGELNSSVLPDMTSNILLIETLITHCDRIFISII